LQTGLPWNSLAQARQREGKSVFEFTLGQQTMTADMKRNLYGKVPGSQSSLGWLSAVCWIGFLLLWAGVGSAAAQNTAQLTVSITVQSSLQLIFQNNPNVGTVGFCPLTNPNTNNVGLDLGVASAQGGSDSLACVAYTYTGSGHSHYQVASAFDVVVTKSNSSSPNYRLAAEISSLPPANVTWMVNNITLTSGAFTTLNTSNSYNTPATETLQLQVASNVTQSILQETLTFLATAN
jgi:hypothetical protein